MVQFNSKTHMRLWHPLSLPLSPSLTHIHSLSLFEVLSLAHTHTHTHTHKLSHARSHTNFHIILQTFFSHWFDWVRVRVFLLPLSVYIQLLTTHNNYNIISIHKIVFTLCLQSFFYLDFYCVFLLITILSISSLSILLLLIEFVFLHIPTFSSCLVYFNLIIILITFSLSILFPFYFIIPDFRFFHVFHPSCM